MIARWSFHLLPLCVTSNIYQETINTRRTDDFAIIFSFFSSLSHKGIHDITHYYSILFPIKFFLWFSHVFFVCFQSVSYVIQAKLCSAHVSSWFYDLLPLFTPKLIQRGESSLFQLGSAHVSPQNDCQWLCIITAGSFFRIFSSWLGQWAQQRGNKRNRKTSGYVVGDHPNVGCID